jgi:hypothetical protein
LIKLFCYTEIRKSAVSAANIAITSFFIHIASINHISQG